METTQTPRKRRSTAEIKQLLQEQETGGKPVREFCKARGINESNFFNWRKKYSAGEFQSGDFIRLQPDKGSGPSLVFAEIEHPTKVVIRLYRQVDPLYLKALL